MEVADVADFRGTTVEAAAEMAMGAFAEAETAAVGAGALAAAAPAAAGIILAEATLLVAALPAETAVEILPTRVGTAFCTDAMAFGETADSFLKEVVGSKAALFPPSPSKVCGLT